MAEAWLGVLLVSVALRMVCDLWRALRGKGDNTRTRR